MTQVQGADSEVGQLRTVLMHRPGLELQRITPRHRDRLLFGALPWVAKARQEHDVLAQELRGNGAQVLYLTALLQDVLEYQRARDQAIGLAVADAELGDELRASSGLTWRALAPESLAQVLIAGLTPEELKIGHGVVFELLDRHDFVLEPLPNLIFTKDSSVSGSAIRSPSPAWRPARGAGRATPGFSVIYRHHPRFAGTRWLYEPGLEHLDGGDVLLMSSLAVVAVGVGHPEHALRRPSGWPGGCSAPGWHTLLLAVPIRRPGGAGHLDTMCALVDSDAVAMHPATAYSLTALTISPRPDGMRVSRPPALPGSGRAGHGGRPAARHRHRA